MHVVAGCFLMGEGAGILETLPNVSVVRVDVADEDSVKKAVEEVETIVENKGTSLHCLVNNAATGIIFAEAAWQTVDQVRITSLLDITGKGEDKGQKEK